MTHRAQRPFLPTLCSSSGQMTNYNYHTLCSSWLADLHSLRLPGMWPAVSRLPQVSPSLISLPPSSDQVGFSSLLVCPLLAWSWGFLSGHVWYLGLEDSFLWRGWLAHRKMFGRFLASTHQMQVGTPEWRTKNVFGHGQLSPGCKIVADGEHCSTYM